MQDVRSTISLREVWAIWSIGVAKVVKKMAKVLASIKVFPSDANIDLPALRLRIERALPSGSSVQRFDDEPIAFGLVALVAHVVMPEDVEGIMDKVEEAIKSVELVSEIQVLKVVRF
ncbi:MAG TPA: elongation factor 1-beta [Candidatus Acidoferrum sp.]|nr:elongation factor 1-beta [Candidatus Acidoferrum sp.]